MRALPALLALAFPLLSHAAAISGVQALALAAVACLALAVLWPLRSRPPRLLAALLVLALVLAALQRAGRVDLLLLFPPVLITAGVALLFARSLVAGRTPLIERVVRAIHPEALALPGVLAQTRRLTLGWALLLGGLALGNFLLAALAAPGGWLDALGVTPPGGVRLAHWSWFANVFNYVAIALMMVGEYAYRRWRWPQPPPYRHLGDFLARMARLGPAFWRGS